VLEINNLFFSYEGSHHYLLNDINLSISKGNYTSILGENGSGKSTLLKLILGFIKPSKGSIKVNANMIGYVPQKQDNFNAQFPLTVFELLNNHRNILKIKDKNTVINVLEAVKMEDYKNSLVGNLSGGQRQRVFIARALIGGPELLILDEPSTGVDLESQNDIYSLIRHLNKDHKITVLSVEHNLSAAVSNSSNIYYIENGSCSTYFPEEYHKIFKKLEVS
jgi:zinc transport system ATP-binding protein